MWDMRLAATTVAILVALMSVSLADAVKGKLPEVTSDKAQPVAQSSTETRPIRVILPATWEPSKAQAEAQPTK
jgi:hypothetical protein